MKQLREPKELRFYSDESLVGQRLILDDKIEGAFTTDAPFTARVCYGTHKLEVPGAGEFFIKIFVPVRNYRCGRVDGRFFIQADGDKEPTWEPPPQGKQVRKQSLSQKSGCLPVILFAVVGFLWFF